MMANFEGDKHMMLQSLAHARRPLTVPGALARRALMLTTILSASAFVVGPALAQTLPSGGKVISGAATISTAGTSTTISQSSGKAILTWNDFSIGQGGSVQFNNGSGATLNRVTGGNLSSIDGLLSATGSVYLINTNGVVIGKSGVVKTGGSFVASTLDLSDANFLAGGDSSFSGASTAGVVNLGTVGALGGNIVLIGATVENDGSLTAANGTAGLAAGHSVLLKDTATDQGLFTVAVGGSDTSVTNTGSIAAASAELRANGGSIYALAGNTDGLITATGVGAQDGHIWLVADGGTVSVSNTSLSATEGSQGGNVETSGDTVHIGDGTHVSTVGSSGAFGDWLIDPTDFTVAASGGDMTGATLSSDLGSGNVTLLSSNGASGTNGDININAAVSWSAATTLTLNAYRDINVNATITSSNAAGKIAFDYGQGAVAASNTATYTIGAGAAVNLAAGTNFSTKLGSDGSVTTYTVITSLGAAGSTTGTDLQGMTTSGNYVLGANIDASATSTWNSGAGFKPIGQVSSTSATDFNGIFDGLGHSISNLTINQPSYAFVGLFAGSTGKIQNLILGGTIKGGTDVGAVTGWNAGGTISNTTASAAVSGASVVGGLAGQNSGTINSVTDSGNVTGTSGEAGGLVGYNSGAISNAHASGTVALSYGVAAAGGLVGEQGGGTVANSSASGAVSASQDTGGLVGEMTGGSVTGSDAIGAVSSGAGGGSNMGGLIGYLSNSSVSSSYATGTVNGGVGSYVGGLVGFDYNSAISNAYATGAVTGYIDVGGVVGELDMGTLANDYATSQITGTYGVGGLLGYMVGGSTLNNSFYNADVVTINGGHLMSAGGLYNAQYVDWSSHGLTLTIGNYLTQDSNGYYKISSITDFKNMLGFSETAGLKFELTGDLSLGDTLNLYLPYFGGAVFDGKGHTVNYLDVDAPNSALGFIGYLNGGTVANIAVANNGSVTAGGENYQIGGLVGYDYHGTISNASANDSVQAAAGSNVVGGLVGYQAQGSVINSYATGSVSGSGEVGGLIGGIDPVNFTLQNSFYDIDKVDINGNTGTIGLGGIYDVQYRDWKADGLSLNIANYLVPDGNGNYLIATETDLKNLLGFAETSGLKFKLAADVDLDYGFYIPYFAGTFDGGGHNISADLDSNNAQLGLFGLLVAGGAINNLNASGTIYNTYSGAANIGFLVGYNNGALSNDTVQGQLEADNTVSNVGGLVGTNTGTISHSFSQATVIASPASDVGGLVGYNYGGTITTSAATGSVSGNSDTGGLVGYNYGYGSGGIITSSYASGQVSGGFDAGGLVGDNQGQLTGDYALGAVSGSTAGGLVGFNSGFVSGSIIQGAITDSYASGAVSGTSNIGGLVGSNSSGTLTADYWDTQTSGKSAATGSGSATGATGLTTAQFGNASSFAGWTFTSTPDGAGWVIVDTDGTLNNASNATGGTRPMLASEYSTTIDTPHQLQLMAMNLAGNYMLGVGVSFNEGSGTVWTSPQSFLAIGANATPFSGTLSGGDDYNGISNLKIVATGNYAGLIGYNTGTISNIELDDANISGNAYAKGALVGWNAGTISNADLYDIALSGGGDHGGALAGVNSGTVLNSFVDFVTLNTSSYNSGGLLGYNSGLVDSAAADGVQGSSSGQVMGGLVSFNVGTVLNSSASGDMVSNSGQAIGGLVGWNQGGTVTQSSASTEVDGTVSHSGGLVGVNNGGTLSDDNASGLVDSGTVDAGGLVGSNAGTINGASYATNQVETSAGVAGGLVGTNAAGATVSSSYSNGYVYDSASSAHVGGLVGVNSGTVSDDYTLGVTFGQVAFSVGGVVGYNNGTVARVYSSGVTYTGYSATNMGAVVGYNGGTVSNAYWDQTINSTTAGIAAGTTTGASGLTTAQFGTASNFSGWAFTSTAGGSGWVIVDSDSSLNNAGGAAGATRPMLASEYSTTILNPHQLQLIAMNLAGNYNMVGGYVSQDGDSSSVLSLSALDNTSDVWITAEKFIPLGNGAVHFSGLFEGAGADIDGLEINASGNYVGLFGYNTGTIRNLMVSDVNINGSAYTTGVVVGWNAGTLSNVDVQGGYLTGSGSYVGGLAGVNSGTISDSEFDSVTFYSPAYAGGGIAGYNSGSIIGSGADEDDIRGGGTVLGGLVGYESGGSVTGSSADDVNVNGTGQSVGGFVGWNDGGTMQTDQSRGGVVEGAASHIGGFAGVNNNGVLNTVNTGDTVIGSGGETGGLVAWNSGTIINGQSYAAVSGSAGTSGGLVGLDTSTGSISQSLAFGNVVNTSSTSHVGGLVGVNDAGASVTDSYAAGPVTASGVTLGGLIGYNAGTVSRVYATGPVTGTATNTGGLVGYNSGTITDGYYDYLTTGQASGTQSNGSVGLSTVLLQAGLPAGFGGNVWMTVLSAYPVLAVSGTFGNLAY